jgi:hypothetical protein
MSPSFQQFTAGMALLLYCNSFVQPVRGQAPANTVQGGAAVQSGAGAQQAAAAQQDTALQADAAQLNIIITDGQGAINNVRLRTVRNLAIRVEDEKQQPVAGATVTFTLPSVGASGSFPKGDKTLIVQTDASGAAIARGLKPNAVTGKMEVRVTVSHRGRTASANITQFNMAVNATAQQDTQKSGSGKWLIILLAAGGAGAAGAVLGTRGGSSTSSGPTPTPVPTIGITAGQGSVGPPQ